MGLAPALQDVDEPQRAARVTGAANHARVRLEALVVDVAGRALGTAKGDGPPSGGWRGSSPTTGPAPPASVRAPRRPASGSARRCRRRAAPAPRGRGRS